MKIIDSRTQPAQLTVLTFFFCHLWLHLFAMAVAANGLSASLRRSRSSSWLDDAPRWTDGLESLGWMYPAAEGRFSKKETELQSDGRGRIWWKFNDSQGTRRELLLKAKTTSLLSLKLNKKKRI